MIFVIELIEIKKEELKAAHKMHRQGFMPTFIKYKDKINPIFMSFGKFKSCYNSPKITMFWIVKSNEKVGQIWIWAKDDTAKIVRIFVLPAFQNKGIAQHAIQLAEDIFRDYKRWWLDTIKQEKNNCHLYEKMGYHPIGKERVINKRMTIIEYEKRME